MHANLAAEVAAAGWRDSKYEPGTYLSPSNDKIDVSISVDDPAVGGYTLRVHAPCTFIPKDASTGKPLGVPADH